MDLTLKAKQIRRDVLNASYEAGACHLGSALSCVDMLVDLFYKEIKPEDRFIFSKASGVATYYAILADKGFFSKKKIAHYLKTYPLPSKEVPGVIHSTGSLGMGLSVAVGLALADRTRGVYCLISDGEMEEGNTYEALLSARRLQLKNLFIYLDYNHIGACKRIEEDFGTMFPEITVFHTKKGKGIPFMEDVPAWHYRNLNKKSLKEALKWI